MTIDDVENLAELAKIELSLDEKQAILKDMGGILEYVQTIEKVEVGDVVVEYEQKNIWREDKVVPREFSSELLVEQFPDSQEGFLKVKKIL
ncbi:MAG: Asp-tRNA(Asn)/Glu-tRNA(Gln) amidotransferase subunit GatC [Candidatus Paceibacterota bacterium]|jgi:aspartyl/glutamyl-tRNA(Asn/Gln) amidotransferase C subunit